MTKPLTRTLHTGSVLLAKNSLPALWESSSTSLYCMLTNLLFTDLTSFLLFVCLLLTDASL